MRPTCMLHDAGQSLWVDNITRAMLDSGTLEHYVRDLCVTGLTSNPTIFDHAIARTRDYDDAIRAHVAAGKRGEDLFLELAFEDLRRAADLFMPAHERTAGVDGWVSVEVSPLLAHDAKDSLLAAERLHGLAGRPNVFVKIPGTEEGLGAIEEAIFRGIPINVTLLFSPDQYVAAASAYMRGIERRVADGLDPVVASVASIFVSRWDRAVHDVVPRALANKLGLAVAGVTYKTYHQLLASDRWQRLANMGARPQRLLFASTSTKDPDAPDLLYVEGLAAPHTIDTMPESTLRAFDDHGKLDALLTVDAQEAERVLSAHAEAGIRVDELAERLQREGAESFAASWRDLLAGLESKCAALGAAASAAPT
ncbi:MAG TPA: transaldolase [Polyangiaceae bacterium]|nr:transaldolase [Polyangiaceae bacterium]